MFHFLVICYTSSYQVKYKRSGCVKVQALRKQVLEKLKQYYVAVNLYIGKKTIMIILHVRHQAGSGL